MSPDEYCQEKAAQSGSSFYYSFLFLPVERRRAITALYAFCREVDDVVDELGSRPAIEYISRIFELGTGADRQLAVYRQTGSLVNVVDYIQEQFLTV